MCKAETNTRYDKPRHIDVAFINSFIQAISNFYSASSSPLLLRGAPDYSTNTVPEVHAEAPQATVSEGLAQGPHVVATAGVKPMTLRTKGVESTNAPPMPDRSPRSTYASIHNISLKHIQHLKCQFLDWRCNLQTNANRNRCI